MACCSSRPFPSLWWVTTLAKHSGSVRKYITLGSPLVRSIQRWWSGPLTMPSCVEDGWFNAYDDRDVVALCPLDKHSFDIILSHHEQAVKKQTENRHGIEGYLNDPTWLPE